MSVSLTLDWLIVLRRIGSSTAMIPTCVWCWPLKVRLMEYLWSLGVFSVILGFYGDKYFIFWRDEHVSWKISRAILIPIECLHPPKMQSLFNRRRSNGLLLLKQQPLKWMSAYIPKKAVGEMFPFRIDTIIVIPVSRNGMEKSTTSLRFGVIFNDVRTRSALWSWICFIRPFHSPVL